MASFWHFLKTPFQRTPATADVPVQALYPVDMHCHLIPGVDDGVQDAEESLQCLRQLAQWGIRHVVATPHVSQDTYPNQTDGLRRKADELRLLIEAERLPLTFDVAAEYMTDELFDTRLKQNDLLSFGTEKFVLIETGWAMLPRQLPNWIFQLQMQGYRPVLAHPERYRYFRTKPDALGEMREQGCLLQLNLISLSGRYGEQATEQAKRLIRSGWVDFVSSDMHRLSDCTHLETAMRTPDYHSVNKLPLTQPTF